MELTVLHLTGLTGTGKTKLLQKFSDENPGSIQILTPAKAGQVFDVSVADLASHSAIAIDEVPSWDRVSVADGIASLEAYAEQSGKKLILVSQAKDGLDRLGVAFRTVPVMIRLEGPQQPIGLAFDGQNFTFPAT